MRSRILLFAVFSFVFVNSSLSQIVGTNAFLQGRYLEIGELGNGSFGASSIPAGYHPHLSTGGGGAWLAEVYDYGHDGWTVGTPPYMGDYTYPGSPFEGWEVQCNGQRAQAYQYSGTGYTFSGGGTMTSPGITSYTNSGGSIRTIWNGVTAGTLSMKMETRVDTLASAVVMTVFFHNTGGTAIPGVYYWRSCDPDNDETWPGGGFPTDNVVDFQNAVLPNPTHKVSVTARGYSSTHPPLTLCTKDCRAVAIIYNAWGLTVTQDLAALWNQTYGTATYTPGVHDPGDIAIGLVYNLGTIAAGDSAVISYAYVFNGPTGIDSIGALPDPQLAINGVGPVSFPDTFDLCSLPSGVDTTPVDIWYGSDKDWTWSKWTWTPATGLSATTGTHVVIHGTALSGPTTYTVSGTDSATGMYSCNTKQFVFTVKPCHYIFANNPCAGDTLKLSYYGDSTSSTYSWSGPSGFTSTMHNPLIFPCSVANQGLYHFVRSVGGSPVNTDSVYVTVHPLPVVTVTSNAPLCVSIGDSLKLFVNLDSLGETFRWTGPALFTSTVQDPTVYGFNSTNVGVYQVTGTTIWGCKDTASLYAGSVPPPPAPIISGITQYCYGTPFTPFTVAGVNILWYPTSSSTVGTPTAPVVPTSTPGTYTYYATQTAGCLSPMDSITVTVFPEILPSFTTGIRRACPNDTLYVTNTSVNAISYRWAFNDGTALLIDPGPALLSHQHIFVVQGNYSVILTAFINTLCSASDTVNVNTLHSVNALFAPVQDTVCFGSPITFNNLSTTSFEGVSGAGLIVSDAWTYGNGATDNVVSPTYVYPAPGAYPVSLTVTDSIGCVSSYSMPVYVVNLSLHTVHDTTLCLGEPLQLLNNPVQYPQLGLTDYTYTWTPATGLSDASAQSPFFNAFGSYTYTVTDVLQSLGCMVSDTIHINSVQSDAVSNVTASQTILYGSSIQLNATGPVLYHWLPDDGSLDNNNINNPVASPTHTTTYTVFGLDKFGCPDSAYVTVYVDTSTVNGIPSGFTPNNDGLNDVFKPVGTKFQRMVEMRVFNRWGEQVFYSNNREVGWDGTYKNAPQDMGTYFYEIIVANPGGDNEVYKGNLTLIR